jgi:hypothetical protein
VVVWVRLDVDPDEDGVDVVDVCNGFPRSSILRASTLHLESELRHLSPMQQGGEATRKSHSARSEHTVSFATHRTYTRSDRRVLICRPCCLVEGVAATACGPNFALWFMYSCHFAALCTFQPRPAFRSSTT